MSSSRPLRSAASALVLLLGLLCSGRAAAQASSPSPADGNGAGLRIFVMTMGPGDEVWERFGHNAIWVHDPERGTDLAYNYGMFSFQQENFLLRFIQGRMLYWMEGFDAYLTIDHYRAYNRSVWIQELNLTPAERAEMRDFLEWNARPENRFYRYDYYRDNCSTRVRDAIDRVVGGRIRQATDTVPTGTSYRSHTRRLTRDDLPVYTGLEAALGPATDRELSAWDEMFLPLQLRDHLRRVTVRDESGRLVPLVKSEQTAFEASRPPLPQAPPRWIPGYLLAGVLLGGALALLGRLAPAHRAARIGLAALGGIWSLVAGVGGLIMAGLWAFTDHVVAYRNENLLQLDPLSLALVVLIPALALGARWAARPARALALAVAALSLLGFLLQALPGVDQVNGEIIALALPVNLGLAWAAHRRGNGESPAPGRSAPGKRERAAAPRSSSGART